LRFEGSLEFGEGRIWVFEQIGILLPVGHLTGRELADDQRVIDFYQQD
jgi:hypothetical protein